MNDNKPEKPNVIEFGPHAFMDVDELIDFISRNRENIESLMIIGHDTNGEFMSITSHMTRSDALWLVKLAEMNVMEPDPIEPTPTKGDRHA